jgi:hypothetical protein
MGLRSLARASEIKKPQAFTHCGSPGSKIYEYEISPAPVLKVKAMSRLT